MLQKPIDEPTGFDKDKLCRASFFPRAPVPAELQAKIEYTLRYQRQLFVPDRILKGRPMTTEKAQSRFNGHSARVQDTLTPTRNDSGAPFSTTQPVKPGSRPLQVKEQHYLIPTQQVADFPPFSDGGATAQLDDPNYATGEGSPLG